MANATAGSETFLQKIFVDVESLPNDGYGFCQLAFLGLAYGYILMQGANLIKDGSEMLLLIPSWAGIVGPIVLPVLGAVPDGAIVLFSGMGPDAQQQVDVGMGALAGSTIMLLTVPWFLSAIAGRVNMDASGNGNYVRPRGAGPEWAKLSPPSRIRGTGANVNKSIVRAAITMAITLIPWLVIQIPAIVADCSETDRESDCRTPRTAAIVAGCLTVVLFFAYLWDQKRMAGQPEDVVTEGKLEAQRRAALERGRMSLSVMFAHEDFAAATRASEVDETSRVLSVGDGEDARLRKFLKPYFKRFDRDGSGEIDKQELRALFETLGERPSAEDLDTMMTDLDQDGSGGVNFDEFVVAMQGVMRGRNGGVSGVPRASQVNVSASRALSAAPACNAEESEEEEEDEEEMPEDLADLSPEEQRKRILRRAFSRMAFGTLIVVLFSDPMVDVLSKLGTLTHIPPFYVSFVLAPLVSNGSELIAAYAYAGKKTEKSMTIALATLVGSSCMNNTFCLAIFLFLVAGKNLKWVFTAEVTAVVFVELVMLALVFVSGRTFRTWTAFVVVLLFPLSLVLVYLMENVAHLD